MKQTREELHQTYGGIIKLSDFNTENRCNAGTYGSEIAARIASSMRFDSQCQKNAEQKEREDSHAR